MRYEKGRKDTTRKRIVTLASGRFRRHGAKATGVASVMGDAGLTHGGFYAHFGSKEELFRAAVAEALDLTYGRLSRRGTAGGLEAMVRDYLGEWHIARPDQGCAFAALIPEMARSSRSTRTAVAQKLEDFFDLIAEHLPGNDLQARRRRAVALFGMMMGTLQLARAVPSGQQSSQILEDGIEAALALAKVPETRGVPPAATSRKP
jgi:TetR/AcrR family transcriptional regulator, transcriptional repressor for nem operon